MESALYQLILVVMVGAAAVLLAVAARFAFNAFAGNNGSAPRAYCGFRRDARDPWLVGTLSYETDRLVYSKPGGRFASATHQWDRYGLDVSIGATINGADVAQHLRGVDMVCVPCRFKGEKFELAVTTGRYTALRSWVEAVPPGSNVNVA